MGSVFEPKNSTILPNGTYTIRIGDDYCRLTEFKQIKCDKPNQNADLFYINDVSQETENFKLISINSNITNSQGTFCSDEGENGLICHARTPYKSSDTWDKFKIITVGPSEYRLQSLRHQGNQFCKYANNKIVCLGDGSTTLIIEPASLDNGPTTIATTSSFPTISKIRLRFLGKTSSGRFLDIAHSLDELGGF